ncbi:MAG: PAS domain S-box protein [Elusimicrobia bacterium]|nr:PAS domain S-box protein [Elusimicrobiota bacterium]
MARLADIEAEDQLPVVMVNSHGLITRVNREFERLFGWTSAEVFGKPLTIIIPPSLREAHQAGFSRLLVTNQPRLLNQPIRLKAVNKAGREFIAEHFIVGERHGGEWFFGATIREVPPR